MKNKIKPKPRVMWANYYPLAGWSHPCIHPTLSQAKATAAGCAKPVRVAVIPLSDPGLHKYQPAAGIPCHNKRKVRK